MSPGCKVKMTQLIWELPKELCTCTVFLSPTVQGALQSLISQISLW